MQSNTRFGAYLYSAGTRHENLLKSIDYEQCDRVTYFISQANAGIRFSQD